MSGISEIKIIGIDEDRPPVVRKENYIDLFFKLSSKAPADWCDHFNTLGHRIKPPAKISGDKGLIVETYVHDMTLIQQQLDKIKTKITECTQAYLEKQKQERLALLAKQAQATGTSAKQNQLNEIISALNYEN